MSEEKKIEHTPGKWADIKGYIVIKNGHTLASVNSYNTSEGRANARLIAAAPDLLDACKAALETLTSEDAAGLAPIIGSDNPHEHAAGLVAAAISKATGAA